MTGRRSAGRRAVAGILTLSFVAAAGVLASLTVEGSGAQPAEEATDESAATATAVVTQRDLEERVELAGTLGYGDRTDVTLSSSGTITAVPALGTIVNRGETLVEVDGRPVPLWFGERPLWRALAADASDGADVREVEENLVALGHATNKELTVDETWTSATTRAVKAWQKSIGLDETGAIAPGDVLVLPQPARIAGHPTPVGGQAAGPVASITSATQQVTIDLDATKRSLVAPDQAVEVVLPDGSVLDGTISSIGSVADADQGGDPLNPPRPTISVTISLADATGAAGLDEAPVTVRVVTSAAEDVLAVPVDALLALAEGGYGVERRTGSVVELIAVETGAFADGWVEIDGALDEGDEVVVPA